MSTYKTQSVVAVVMDIMCVCDSLLLHICIYVFILYYFCLYQFQLLQLCTEHVAIRLMHRAGYRGNCRRCHILWRLPSGGSSQLRDFQSDKQYQRHRQGVGEQNQKLILPYAGT